MNVANLNKFFNKDHGLKMDENYAIPNYDHLAKELVKLDVTMWHLWEEYMEDCRLQKK